MSQKRKSAQVEKTNDTPKYLSLDICQLLMKTVGYWNAETQFGQYASNALLFYTLSMTVGAVFLVSQDIYYVWGDFYAMTYAACSVMPVIVVLSKLATFLIHRNQIMDLIKYTEDHFWYICYDSFGECVMVNNNKKALMLLSSFTFFVFGTCFCYAVTPLVENVGKNQSDWMLPFTLWNLPLPVNESPYYEILFLLEVAVVFETGLCFCCFDNFLGILNIHTAGQFKILQYKIRTIHQDKENEVIRDHGPTLKVTRVYENLKTYVQEHLVLIRYVEKLENMFSFMVLSQLVISGIMICVAGFQASQSQNSFIRRLIFIDHTLGSFFQIFVITLTANEVIIESQGIGNAAYDAKWYITHDHSFYKLKKGLVMMMIRASRPCCLTAGRFFPVSLDTFVTVISTAASYFTLLRSIEQEKL